MARLVTRRRGPIPSTPAPTVTTPHLPFNQAAAAAYDASAVVAALHIMDFWQSSFDDKNADTDPTEYYRSKWAPPGAIEGPTDHRVYGGLVRNRPIGRPPRGTGYVLADKRADLAAVKGAGMRHAYVNLGGTSAASITEWAQAASLEQLPRAIIPMPDSGGGATAAQTVTALTALFNSPYASSVRKHTDGRWLIAPFGPEAVAGTEQGVIDYWTTVMQGLAANSHPTAMWPCFVRPWDNAGSFTAPTFTKPALSSWVVGLGRWGSRNPVEVVETSAGNRGAPASCQSKYGLPWQGFGFVEDNRPRSNDFNEAGGWDGLVSSCLAAIETPTTMLELMTGNDWAEQTAMLPSIYHGYADLDVLAYYTHRFRLGSYPTIVRDTLYLAHRVQFGPTGGTTTYTAGAAYTARQTLAGSTPERNIVDVLVFATAPGNVEITTSAGTTTTAVTAGVTRVTAPLALGTISCRMTRSSTVVPGTEITSPWQVTNTQVVQDLTYRRRSSRR